jgi:hypothetical protein
MVETPRLEAKTRGILPPTVNDDKKDHRIGKERKAELQTLKF